MKYEFGSMYNVWCGALNDICQLFWSHLHITMYCIVNSYSYIEDHTTGSILFVVFSAISFVLLGLLLYTSKSLYKHMY